MVCPPVISTGVCRSRSRTAPPLPLSPGLVASGPICRGLLALAALTLLGVCWWWRFAHLAAIGGVGWQGGGSAVGAAMFMGGACSSGADWRPWSRGRRGGSGMAIRGSGAAGLSAGHTLIGGGVVCRGEIPV